jgi:hypothetical protein
MCCLLWWYLCVKTNLDHCWFLLVCLTSTLPPGTPGQKSFSLKIEKVQRSTAHMHVMIIIIQAVSTKCQTPSKKIIFFSNFRGAHQDPPLLIREFYSNLPLSVTRCIPETYSSGKERVPVVLSSRLGSSNCGLYIYNSIACVLIAQNILMCESTLINFVLNHSRICLPPKKKEKKRKRDKEHNNFSDRIADFVSEIMLLTTSVLQK